MGKKEYDKKVHCTGKEETDINRDLALQLNVKERKEYINCDHLLLQNKIEDNYNDMNELF